MIFWKTTETSKPSWTVKHHSPLRNEYCNSAIPKHPTRLAWYFNFQSSWPLSFQAKSRKTRIYCFQIQWTISLLLNKDSKPTTQLFCVVKIICGSSRIRTYSVIRQRFYRPPQLSYFDVLPFCLGNSPETSGEPVTFLLKRVKQQIVIFPINLGCLRDSNPVLWIHNSMLYQIS